jgi:hypothetical protein
MTPKKDVSLGTGLTRFDKLDLKSSPVHLAPSCVGSREGSDHFDKLDLANRNIRTGQVVSQVTHTVNESHPWMHGNRCGELPNVNSR